MKCLYLYNPESGKGKILKHIPYIKNKLSAYYDEVVVLETSVKEVTKQIYDLVPSFDVIVFSGGDGSFSHVVNGIMKYEYRDRPILGYIPSGTTNDMARNLKLPKKSIKKSLDIILKGSYQKYDAGKINDQYFVYVAGIGTTTQVSWRTKRSNKKAFGRAAYFGNALNDFFKMESINASIEIDDKIYEYKSPLILICNTKTTGRLFINKNRNLNDGHFEVYIVKGEKIRGAFKVIFSFIAGAFGIKNMNCYHYFKTNFVRIKHTSQIPWCIDGEKGMNGNVEIKCIPNAFKIFVKDKK